MTNGPESGAAPAFVFFHYGGIPRYLRASVESVRFSNPESRIILVCDREPGFPKSWSVEVYPLEKFETPALEAFRKAYVHISVFRERYERFVLERWFLLDELRRQLGLGLTVLLDSDIMVFEKIGPLFPQTPDLSFSTSGWSPHFTLIRRGVGGFLDHIMARYRDAAYVAAAKEKFAKARAAGELKNLGEMEFIWEHLSAGKDAAPYERRFREGYVDINIHLPDGFDAVKLRRRERKRVFWKFEAGTYKPYLRDAESGALFPAAVLHFQGSGKGLMRRFNPLGRKPLLPPALRCAWLNWTFNRSFEAS